MVALLEEQKWFLDTRGVDSSFATGVFFFFLGYVLQPAIASAYKRARAYRAWRAIEKQETVEVTSYSMAEEVFRGREKCNAGRVTTVVLATFSLASWGLETSIYPGYCEGAAAPLNRPPPVTVANFSGGYRWQVKSRQDLDYDGDWLDLPNMFEDRAKSRYFLDNGIRRPGGINGAVIVAYWYTEAERTPSQYYYSKGTVTTVTSLVCPFDEGSHAIDIYHGDAKWGTVAECVQGPGLTSDGLVGVGPPTILLTRSDGEEFLIAMETGSYPNYLYSVWTVGSESGGSSGSLELHHEFHIGATMPLAEAVVTGIVHGETSGGGCVGLLRTFSEARTPYDDSVERACPFGEHPNGDGLNLEDEETIECGLEIGSYAFLCLVCLLSLTLVGITWFFYLRSGISMDVYDRDALIRAVSLREAPSDGTRPSAMRIFVHRDDTGKINVVVSDTGKVRRRGCAGILRNFGTLSEDVGPAPKATTVPQSNAGSVGPRTVSLEGVRTGKSRALPGPNGDFRYPTSAT